MTFDSHFDYFDFETVGVIEVEGIVEIDVAAVVVSLLSMICWIVAVVDDKAAVDGLGRLMWMKEVVIVSYLTS